MKSKLQMKTRESDREENDGIEENATGENTTSPKIEHSVDVKSATLKRKEENESFAKDEKKAQVDEDRGSVYLDREMPMSKYNIARKDLTLMTSAIEQVLKLTSEVIFQLMV